MSAQTFGQLLGTLVRQKRRAQGLTQTQLAEDAFGTSGKTRRISELESGSVANPHPKTIDPIIAILGISEQEIEECAKSSNAQPDPALDRAYREARNLIEAVARQFENNDPTATLAELDQFLRTKAEEWTKLRRRLQSLEAGETQVAELQRQAGDALNEGRFDAVDRYLEEAEEIFQQNRTLNEIRKQASIRISRGDTALLKGSPDAALSMYISAVEFFRPFDQNEMANTADELAFQIYENSRRSIKPVFFIAATLIEKMLTIDIVFNDEIRRGDCQYRLGLCYRNEHDTPSGLTSDDVLLKAIQYSRLAVENPKIADDPERFISSVIGLANCLRDKGKLNSNSTNIYDMKEAENLLISLENKFDYVGGYDHLKSHLYNSLGAIQRNLMIITKDDAATEARERSIKSFQKAIQASEASFETDVWGAAHFNIGIMAAEKINEDKYSLDEKYFLRIQAISYVSAAIESFSAIAFPLRLGDAHHHLSRLLFEHANSIKIDSIAEAYLYRAIQSAETAAAIIDPERNAGLWADIQILLGYIFCHHAERTEPEIAIQDLEQGARFFESAIKTLESQNLKDKRINIFKKAVAQVHNRRKDIMEEMKK